MQNGVYEEFSQKLTAKVKKIRCGSGLDPLNSAGPLINQAALDKVQVSLEL